MRQPSGVRTSLSWYQTPTKNVRGDSSPCAGNVMGLCRIDVAVAVSPWTTILLVPTMCWKVLNIGIACARNSFVDARSPELPPVDV